MLRHADRTLLRALEIHAAAFGPSAGLDQLSSPFGVMMGVVVRSL
jgi:hypothetical protein